VICIQENDFYSLNDARFVQGKGMNILCRNLQTLLHQVGSHLSAVDGVLKAPVQPLVVIGVKVREEVGGAARNRPILERVHNNTCTWDSLVERAASRPLLTDRIIGHMGMWRENLSRYTIIRGLVSGVRDPN